MRCPQLPLLLAGTFYAFQLLPSKSIRLCRALRVEKKPHRGFRNTFRHGNAIESNLLGLFFPQKSVTGFNHPAKIPGSVHDRNPYRFTGTCQSRNLQFRPGSISTASSYCFRYELISRRFLPESLFTSCCLIRSAMVKWYVGVGRLSNNHDCVFRSSRCIEKGGIAMTTSHAEFREGHSRRLPSTPFQGVDFS